MRILFIADARSTISRGWVKHFIERGDDVHVVSSYPCSSDMMPGATVYQAPIAFSGFSRVSHNGTIGPSRQRSLITRGMANLRIGALSGLSNAMRNWLGPIELNRHVQRTRDLIARISPDIVHAMRIPFEGILAAKATPAEFPLVISVWGNDFTLFASNNPLIARQTRKALRRADALHTDCRRDLRLAIREWGFQPEKPSSVLPSAGGIPASVFHPGEADATLRYQFQIPAGATVVINPRGFRTYVRNEVFFQAIPLVLKKHPEAIFICTGMESNPIAEKWVAVLGVDDNVRLLPVAPHHQMADLFRLADITVSPSQHDGTPNSLLEAMACGCFPVAGDIESVREWITDGENGLLCDPTDKASVASALLRALEDRRLRDKARAHNLQLIVEQVDYDNVMRKAEEFYHQVARRAEAPHSGLINVRN